MLASMLTLAVLGPVAVRRDGALLRVPAGKTGELLVRLALEAGKPLRSQRLLEDLWPDLPQGASPNTLQSKASRLRGALGEPGVLPGDGLGYTLRVPPDSVDAVHVLRLAGQAGSLRAAGDPAAALALCEQGLALFQGDVLPSAVDAPWALPYRVRLESTRLDLAEGRLSAKAALGAASDLVGELEELVTAHPLRESLWVLLVAALYRSGRQGDALAAAARVRRQLADELGIDPGPELQRLEQQVLQQDPALVAPRETTALVDARRPSGNLPLHAGTLVGRSGDVDRLVRLLGEQRLVTVTGPAGVGKSRLAVEGSRRCSPPGGAWLARLETASDTTGVWQRLADALRIDVPTPTSVIDRLEHADALLVLDGCEHVVGAVGDVLGVLLAAAPRVRFVATSQVPLRVGGEALLEVRPLDLTASVALFTDRATAHLGEDHGPEALRTIEEVCRSLDGLPLAIELAAARTRVLPLHEIARRLEDRFALLRDPTSPLPLRQSTLRAALSWSYDLLFPDDQRGLWALGTFTGGAPLLAVEDVLAALDVPRGAALDVVARLVDRSLAIPDVGSPGGPRYHLLDSVRALSRERLRDAGLTDAAAAAHAAWFADAAERARIGVRGAEQPEHLALARAERANIDAALAWCDSHAPELGLRIALGFGWTWVVLGTGIEGAHKVRAALDAAAAAREDDRAAAWILCGWFEAAGGSLERAAQDLQRAIAIGDARAGAIARLHLAFVHTQAGRPAEALEVLAACRPVLQRFGQVWEEGAGWLLEAWAQIASGRPAEGRAACERALSLLRPQGDGWALAHAEGLLGELAGVEHRYADATAHLRHAAEAAGRLGLEAAHAHHLLNLGLAQQAGGDSRASRDTLQQAADVSAACGDVRTWALARARLAQVMRGAGESAVALEIATSAADALREVGGGDGAGLSAFLVAALGADASAPAAYEGLEGVLEEAGSAGDVEVQVLALDALALLDAVVGHVDRAVARMAEADALTAAAPLRWARDDVDRVRARAELDALSSRRT